MSLLSYTIKVHVHDDTILHILNNARYKLRVGHPPPLGPRVFEPATNKIPFTFKEDHGSDNALVLETIVNLTFTATGWVYSIGYKLPDHPSEDPLLDEHDIALGQVYNVPKTGPVPIPEAKTANDGFVTDQTFGISNAKTVALTLNRRHTDAAADSSTLVEEFPLWLPGFGAITPPADSDSTTPSSIYVWFETHFPLGKAQHEVTGVNVKLEKIETIELYVLSDGTIAAAAEKKPEDQPKVETPPNKTAQ